MAFTSAIYFLLGGGTGLYLGALHDRYEIEQVRREFDYAGGDETSEEDRRKEYVERIRIPELIITILIRPSWPYFNFFPWSWFSPLLYFPGLIFGYVVLPPLAWAGLVYLAIRIFRNRAIGLASPPA